MTLAAIRLIAISETARVDMDGHGSGFSVDFASSPAETVIRVQGEIDMAVAAELDAAFRAVYGAPSVELDLAGVTFCDAAGLRVFAAARRRFGPRMRVVGTSAAMRRVAAVVDMDWLAPRDRGSVPHDHYGDRPS
jgi:anti-anti-sigma factor